MLKKMKMFVSPSDTVNNKQVCLQAGEIMTPGPLSAHFMFIPYCPGLRTYLPGPTNWTRAPPPTQMPSLSSCMFINIEFEPRGAKTI